MGSLATTLTFVGVEFSDDMAYRPSMAPRSDNKAMMEKDGMQVEYHWKIQSLYSQGHQYHQTHRYYNWL